MAMKLVKRSSFGWPSTPKVGKAACRNGLVVHYDGSVQNLDDKSHSSCVAYWKGTRKFHMGSSRGWSDIGYSFGVCPHGYVFEGRGFGYQQAAQPGGNSTWTSCTFMSGEGEQPTKAQLQAFRDLRAYLRGSKNVAASIKGHRNFISTSCPGSVLYKLVTNGKSALYTGSTTPSAPAKPTYWKLTVKGKSVTVPWATPMLREGMSGTRVGWLQAALNATGAKLSLDKDFGPKTKAALRTFQSKHRDERGQKLDVDGIYGHHSARGLYIALGGKKESAA